MIRNILSILIVVVMVSYAARWVLSNMPTHDAHDAHDHGHHMEMDEEISRGPHRGRLLEEENFSIEITIFETGVPPEFHVYAYEHGHPIGPEMVTLSIELSRLGGEIDRFEFTPQVDYLRGDGTVTEPHSFDVAVQAAYKNKIYQWSYENYEGRTQIPGPIAQEVGIKTENAGPTIISEYITLNGRVQIDPNRQSQVRARYPGIVKSTRKKLGDTVKKGESLLTVQNNVSLQNYDVFAPIGGLITQRNVQTGESTENEVLYEITDLSEVWVELDVFSKDASLIKTGQHVDLVTLDGQRLQGMIKNLWPIVSAGSQSLKAIIPVENKNNLLNPGQIVNAKVSIAEHEVPLAVRLSAIQQFRDFKVVFARFGETYEARMLDLGRSDREWIEVTGGLEPGTEYVTENSYLIKADIEKSGASHDH